MLIPGFYGHPVADTNGVGLHRAGSQPGLSAQQEAGEGRMLSQIYAVIREQQAEKEKLLVKYTKYLAR